MTKTRYYHLYADGKTVMAITKEEYFAIRQKSASHRTRQKLTARVHIYRGIYEISLAKGMNYVYVRMNQIKECIRDAET